MRADPGAIDGARVEDLSKLPGYMDEFVGACFLPHTSPESDD